MTLTDIANVALEDIGAKAIGSIDSDDSLARKLKRRLPITISEVSSKRSWSCLMKTIKCSRVVDKNFDGRNKFNAPNGLLKIIEPKMCEVQGDFIVHNNESLTITASIVSYNPDDWCDNLRGAIISQLKADIAYMATGDLHLAGAMAQRSNIEVQKFMRNDYYRTKGKRPKMPTILADHII